MLSLPPPFSLRAIGAADQAFIDALYRSTRDDLSAMAVDASFLAQLIRMQQQAQAQGMRSTFPQAQYFLLEREGEAIGRLVFDAAGGHVHLVDLAICPAARSQGGGSAVLRALQALAAQRGQPLLLSVALGNPAARRLYARLGFIATDADALQERLQWQA
jgi:ribosomal protein S18 acetylase RimI-like enzyme